MLAVLCDGKPSELVAAKQLTFYQARRIIQAKRDDKGRVVVVPKVERLTEKERFWNRWRRRCCPEWRIKQLWQEHQKRIEEREKERGKSRRSAR